MLIIYFLLWIVFCGAFNLETTLFGIVLSIPVYWFCCKHMGYDPETDAKVVRKCLRGLGYVVVLVWETVKSNIQVTRFVFAKSIELEPRIIFFRTDLESDAARVALANSITLTPGTITVAVNDDEYCVHCLNSQMAEGIDDSVFVKLLRRLEQ